MEDDYINEKMASLRECNIQLSQVKISINYYSNFHNIERFQKILEGKTKQKNKEFWLQVTSLSYPSKQRRKREKGALLLLLLL